MKKRLIIILLLMSAVIIVAYSVSYAVVYQDWSFYTYDGNEKEILFYTPETKKYYEEHDWSLREDDLQKTIYISGTTVRDVKSTNENVAYVNKEECIGGTQITVYRAGGGTCKIRIRGAAPDANGNYWQECPVLADPTPFKLTRSSYIFDRAAKGIDINVENAYEGKDTYIAKAVSSNTSKAKTRIIKIEGGSAYAKIYPVRAGKVTITVYDNHGKTKKVKVTIKKKYFKGALKNAGTGEFYGKTLRIYDAPVGTKITVKVGKRTYKTTVKPFRDYSVPTCIKLKKKIKNGTKIKLIMRSNGYKVKETLKYNSSMGWLYTVKK